MVELMILCQMVVVKSKSVQKLEIILKIEFNMPRISEDCSRFLKENRLFSVNNN